VRPPLVYGPGVKGNLAVLLNVLAHGVPLPLANARAARSIVGVGNLCSLLLRLAQRDGPFSVYHVRDDADLSAAALIETCSELMGRKPRLFALPVGLLRGLDRVSGRDWHTRFFRPLLVDDRLTREQLNWLPPLSLHEGLSEMVTWWRTAR
jgi:nucleoside-diphosphate-sugar epimerase